MKDYDLGSLGTKELIFQIDIWADSLAYRRKMSPSMHFMVMSSWIAHNQTSRCA